MPKTRENQISTLPRFSYEEFSVGEKTIILQGVSHNTEHYEAQKNNIENIIQKSDGIVLEYTPKTIGFHYKTYEQFRKQIMLLVVLGGQGNYDFESDNFKKIVNEAYRCIEFYRLILEQCEKVEKPVYVCEPYYGLIGAEADNVSEDHRLNLIQFLAMASGTMSLLVSTI